jgi:xylulokinase
LEIMREMGVPIREIRASGGGARSALWRQILADVTGAPIVTLNVDEGPAFGAALLATVASGAYGSVQAACDATIRAVDTCAPNTNAAKTYQDWYALYREMYPALAGKFRRAAELLG